VYTELAAAYRQQGDTPRAARHAQEAIELDVNDARAHYELALTELARGRDSEAILELERARALAPDERIGLLARARLAQLSASAS